MGVGGVPGRTVLLLAVRTLLGGAGGGVAGGMLVSMTSEEDGAATTTAGSAEARRVLVSEESAITEVVEKTGPAVVAVISETQPQRDSLGRGTAETAVGSGVIIDERGFLITNEPRVRGA